MATVIDLFCGAGGFSKGFKDMGYTILLGVDNSVNKLQVYSKNIDPKHYMVATQYLKTGKAKDEDKKKQEIIDKNNLSDLTRHDIKRAIKDKNIDVIIGSPPCKDYSSSNISGKKDTLRSQLHNEFLRIVILIKPDWFVLENVPSFFKSKEGELLSINSALHGYKCKLFLINAKDYGVPQDRKRGFLIGTRLKDVDFNLEKYAINSIITMEDAISDLEETGALLTVNKDKIKSEYQRKLIGDSKFIKNNIQTNHRKKTIEEIQDARQGKKKNKNRVRKYNEISGTITCEFDNFGGKCSNIHPKLDRTFTAREAARLQSFPDNFEFLGTTDQIAKQIGDAVPPLVAECIAKMIKEISGY